MEPLVSVIIPTYNRAEFAEQAVQSVLDQTYRRMEIIVVDDGSTDGTADILKKYEGEINYVYQNRCERSRARNEGFRRSSGDYIAFLDSDDLWLPTKIERQVELMNDKPHVGLVYTDVQFIDRSGNLHNGEIVWDTPQRDDLYEDLMTHNIITGTTSSVMIRRECLEKAGLFDESMNTCEDLDLYRRIAQYYPFYKIDLPLVKFRIHPENTQRNASAMARGWEITIKKILNDTPHEFEHYKNEAIIKILYTIAGLYSQEDRLYRFFYFCLKSVLSKPNWILRYGFWRDFVRMSLNKCGFTV